jgi:2-dehydro-3-deoxygluconokinase
VGYATTQDTLSTAGSFTRFPGGADLNVAVGLSRLGVPATWATVLGQDPHGDYLVDLVSRLGIRTIIRRASGPTALMFKATGGTGDPKVLQVRHDSAFAQHADDVLDGILPIARYQHLHLTGMALGISGTARATALALLEAARTAGLTTSFDPNLRLHLFPDRQRMRHLLNEVAARCTLVLPGLNEGRLLTERDEPEEIAAFYLRAGAGEVVIKLGAAGATAWTASGDHAVAARVHVVPVDTVGAGDGFAAGYLAGLLTGDDLQTRVDQAARAGALVTTRHGDLTAMPTRDELQSLPSSQQQTHTSVPHPPPGGTP